MHRNNLLVLRSAKVLTFRDKYSKSPMNQGAKGLKSTPKAGVDHARDIN